MNQPNQSSLPIPYKSLCINIQEGYIPVIKLIYGPDSKDCVSLLGISPAKVKVSINDSSLTAVKTKALINALQVALQLLPDFFLIIAMKERYFQDAA